jgi:hypothetical protein
VSTMMAYGPSTGLAPARTAQAVASDVGDTGRRAADQVENQVASRTSGGCRHARPLFLASQSSGKMNVPGTYLAIGQRLLSHPPPPARMLIALPAMAVKVMSEIEDCSSIDILARRVRGRVSVGLNAKLVVKTRCR